MPEFITNTLPQTQVSPLPSSGSHVIEIAMSMLASKGRLLRQIAWEIEVDMPLAKTIQAANNLIFKIAREIDNLNISRTPLPKLCVDIDNDQSIVFEWFLNAAKISIFIDTPKDSCIVIVDESPWLEHSEVIALDLTPETLTQTVKFAIYASQTKI